MNRVLFGLLLVALSSSAAFGGCLGFSGAPGGFNPSLLCPPPKPPACPIPLQFCPPPQPLPTACPQPQPICPPSPPVQLAPSPKLST